MHLSADVLFSNLLADLGCHIDPTLPGWAVDSTPKQVAAFCLRDSLLKKFNEEDDPSLSACTAALEKFEAVNKRCANWVFNPEFTKDEEILNEIKNVIHDFWFVGGDSPLISDYRQLYAEGRAGPGASISARDTDFYTKMFDSPLSSTRALPEIWERCVCTDDRHFLAEIQRLVTHGTHVVDSSKYSFVNKTVTVARGICTEPTINMWFQLGMGAVLERRILQFFGIRLDLQPDLNRALARDGSYGNDYKNIVTIDLESASDSLGMPMLKWLLPRSFLGVLSTLRCPATTLPSGRELALNMVSTMGNGFTFPLQTMLFAAVCKGVAIWHQKGRDGNKTLPWLNGSNFGVFGDDIICPTVYARDVIRALVTLGFTVNGSKTFVEGPFRESCGADYFKGINVRGVYIKSLRTEQDVYVAINTLNRWTAKTGVYLNATVCYLLTGIKRLYNVPIDEGYDAGLHTPRCYRKVKAVRVTSASSRIGVDSYVKWEPSKYCFYILGEHVWTYREQVRRSYNPSGLLMTLLYGSIRGYAISLRQRKVRYATRRKITPRWDYFPPLPFEDLTGPRGLRRFVDAWHWNLLGSSAL